MNVLKSYILIILFIISATSFAKNTKHGYLILKRYEENGVMNIRECSITMDKLKHDIILIGGQEEKLSVSVGEHTLFVHSMDPYDPYSKDYSWKSDTVKILVQANKITTVVISPKSNSGSYCCGWKINR